MIRLFKFQRNIDPPIKRIETLLPLTLPADTSILNPTVIFLVEDQVCSSFRANEAEICVMRVCPDGS